MACLADMMEREEVFGRCVDDVQKPSLIHWSNGSYGDDDNSLQIARDPSFS